MRLLSKRQAVQALLWLLPSAIEISVYVLMALALLAISNFNFISDFLLIPADFSFKEALLGSLENLLAELVGTQMAATLITGIFWGIVGMLVYVFIWLFGNFSTELSNDLAITKYVHPRGSDTYSPLKGLVFRLLFHIFTIVILLVYINVLITVFLPLWTTRYSGLIDLWPQQEAIIRASLAILSQVLALHILTIFVRLLLFRKRVFGD